MAVRQHNLTVDHDKLIEAGHKLGQQQAAPVVGVLVLDLLLGKATPEDQKTLADMGIVYVGSTPVGDTEPNVDAVAPPPSPVPGYDTKETV